MGLSMWGSKAMFWGCQTSSEGVLTAGFVLRQGREAGKALEGMRSGGSRIVTVNAILFTSFVTVGKLPNLSVLFSLLCKTS